jgi:hypothetical protein
VSAAIRGPKLRYVCVGARVGTGDHMAFCSPRHKLYRFFKQNSIPSHFKPFLSASAFSLLSSHRSRSSPARWAGRWRCGLRPAARRGKLRWPGGGRAARVVHRWPDMRRGGTHPFSERYRRRPSSPGAVPAAPILSATAREMSMARQPPLCRGVSSRGLLVVRGGTRGGGRGQPLRPSRGSPPLVCCSLQPRRWSRAVGAWICIPDMPTQPTPPRRGSWLGTAKVLGAARVFRWGV